MQETQVLIPGLRRSPGEENGNSLQYSCLENSMDRGAWRAAVRVVSKSQTRLSNLTQTLELVESTSLFCEKGDYNYTFSSLIPQGLPAAVPCSLHCSLSA